MRDKIRKILILDYKYFKKKNFSKHKLIFINKRAFLLNKDLLKIVNRIYSLKRPLLHINFKIPDY